MAEPLSITDRRSDEGDRRQNGLTFLGNGKGPIVRWVVTVLFSAFVAYMTASAQIDKRVSVLESIESAHFQEVMRAIQELKQDIREMGRKRD